MPVGMWLGAFFAFCALGGTTLEIAGFLGFINVDYSNTLIPPTIDFIAKLPILTALIVSAIGFFKKSKWARISAIGTWPLLGAYSVFTNWWVEGFAIANIVEIIVITAIVTVISWRYFFKRQTVVNYFVGAKNT